jgi:acetoin utilization protein AcuB
MLVSEILNNEVLPLKASDTVAEGLKSMLECGRNRMAVMDYTTRKLLGEVLSADLQNSDSGKLALMAFVEKKPFIIHPDSHIIDAAGFMLRENRPNAYVIDKDGRYLGTLALEDLLQPLTKLLNAEQSGSVITLEMNARDYSLTDISRVIELEGVKILGLGVTYSGSDKNRCCVSIKLNQKDIANVIHVLNRYGYVITSETLTDDTDKDLHERADELLRYLGI